jgi:hypothetical protein
MVDCLWLIVDCKLKTLICQPIDSESFGIRAHKGFDFAQPDKLDKT